MKPEIGQRWLWKYGGCSITIVEIFKQKDLDKISYFYVNTIQILRRGSMDKINEDFSIEKNRFNTKELTYLLNQNKI